MEKLGMFARMIFALLFSGPRMLNAADRYLKAWNDHDIDDILAANPGSYTDPLTQGDVSKRDAMRAHAHMLLTALPDLCFELDGALTAGVNRVAARYVLHGTHTGPLPGDLGIDQIEPTGKRIALPGTLFVDYADGAISHIENVFDQMAFADNLGFQGYILPQQMGDYGFGAFYRLNRGSKAPPEAIGTTWIMTKGGDAPFQHVAKITNDVLEDLSRQKGFITGIVGASTPDENGEGYGFTVSAWEKLEDIEQIRPNETHTEVVRQFMKEKVAYGTHSRVYQLVRTKPLMIACEACGKKNNAHNKTGVCSACKQELGEAPAYW